jgi:hypothetical protein
MSMKKEAMALRSLKLNIAMLKGGRSTLNKWVRLGDRKVLEKCHRSIRKVSGKCKKYVREVLGTCQGSVRVVVEMKDGDAEGGRSTMHVYQVSIGQHACRDNVQW